jgi:hypothetical protein
LLVKLKNAYSLKRTIVYYLAEKRHQKPIKILKMKHSNSYYFNIFFKTATWAWLTTIAYLSLSPQINTPIDFNHADKILHLGAYALATLLLLTSYPSNKTNLILLFLYSLSMEIGQLFVENRFFEIYDLSANLSGILIMAYIFHKYSHSYLQNNNPINRF